MNLSIAILAHNEERRIGRTIGELLGQSVLKQPFSQAGNQVEVVTVVNGSTDLTAGTARAAFERAPADLGGHLCVRELCERGKVNAWNEFVHCISNTQADYLLFMDADIRFSSELVIQHLVESLDEDPSAWASVSMPIKDLATKKKKSMFDRLSLLQSKAATASGGWLCGQLYCVRASVARQIVLPRGLLVEDAFLAMMLNSDLFVRDPFLPNDGFPVRVIHPPLASHVFEAYTRPGDLLRQGRRQAAGHAITLMLREWILANRGKMSGAAAIADATRTNPNWFAEHVARTIRQHWWVMPRGVASGRLRTGFRRVKTDGPMALLLAIAGFSWAMTLHTLANVHLKRRRSATDIW